MMTYSIIGAGKVGTALARHFATAGIPVAIANTRGPESLAALAAELGAMVTPATLADALTARTIILALPFRAHGALVQLLADWRGKIVIDAMNTYGVPVEELKGLPSSAVVAAALPGASVVKTFNQLPAALLASDPRQAGGRRVMFVASDDEGAGAEVARLVDRFGFAAIGVGKLGAGGALLGLGGPLILKNLIKLD